MEDTFVKDGRTKELNELQKSIQKSVEEASRPMNIDDFVFENGELNSVLNECLTKWREFPSYRYIINVLCDLSMYNGSANELEILFDEIDALEGFSESSETILDNLADYMIKLMEEISNDEVSNKVMCAYTRDVIRKNLICMEETFFLNCFAPLLELSLDEIDTFLVRVFKRDSLCNYNAEEFLLGLACDIFEFLGKGSLIEILWELKKYYSEIVVSEAIKDNKIYKEGTRYVAEKSMIDYGKSFSDSIAFKVEDYDNIRELLKWYKALEKPEQRDQKEVFEKMMENVYQAFEEELDDYLRVLMKERSLHRNESLSVPVTVWYEPKTEKTQYIEAGTRFLGENCVYEVNKKIELPYQEYVSCLMHVIPHPDNEKMEVPQRKTVPTGAVFEVCKGDVKIDGKSLVKNVRTGVIKQIDPKKNSREWTRPKWIKDEEKSSFVVVDVKVGEKIPKDLCFEYKGFKFLPAEDAFESDTSLKKTFDVYLDIDSVKQKTEKENKKDRVYVLDGTESITRMEPEKACVTKISNVSDRVVILNSVLEHMKNGMPELGRDVQNERQSMSTEQLFCEYMYGIRDYFEATNLDVEKTRTIGISTKNLSWLKDTIIKGDSEWFSSCSTYEQRAVVMVMEFLLYVKKYYAIAKKDRNRFVNDFRVYIDKKMEDMRFDGLYLGYPIDCLVMFLLVTCRLEDLCDTLRVLYKEVNNGDIL